MACDQQAPYQPSGNGIKGQGSWLSFAAVGAALNVGRRARKSSCGTGSIAILTASSNRSNSTSLMALSWFESARSQESFVFELNRSLKLYRSAQRGRGGYRCVEPWREA